MSRRDKGSRRLGPGLYCITTPHPVMEGQWLTIFYQRVKGGRTQMWHRHKERALSDPVLEEFRKWGKFELDSSENELTNTAIRRYCEFRNFQDRDLEELQRDDETGKGSIPCPTKAHSPSSSTTPAS